MEKVKSKRDDSFKKKASTVDKRSLRAHRRSIEWKQLRDQTVNQNRPNIGELSPLQEIHQNVRASKKVESRKEMLLRWKAEKELKKKLEAQEKAKHKPFKVAKCLPVDKTTFKKTTQSTGSISSRPAVSAQRTNTASTVHSKVKSVSTNSNKQVASARTTRSGTASKPVAASSAAKSSTGISRKTTDNVPPVSTRTRATRSTTGTTKQSIATKDNKHVSATTRGRATTNGVSAHDTKQSRVATSKLTSSQPTAPVNKKTSTRQASGDSKKKTISVKSKGVQRKDAKENENAAESIPEPVNPLMVTPKPILKPAKSYMDSVNTNRGGRFGSDSEHSENEKSFAPNNFEFTAPANLQKYSPKFKPLSPGSAARFFMPNDVASPPNDPRRCSTPKFAVTKNPVLHTPQASIIRSTNSVTSGSDSDAQDDATKKTTGAPVLSLNQHLQGDEDLKTPNRNRRSTRGSQDTTPNTTQPFSMKSVSFDVEERGRRQLEEKDNSNEIKMDTNQDDRQIEEKQNGPEDSCVTTQETVKSPVNKSTQSLPEELIATTRSNDKENVQSIPQDAFNVFKTPDPISGRGRRTRTRSLGLALSDKKRKTPRNNRTSLILRHLSPEEGVEVLRHSPMVELTRRTPKAHKSSNSINLEPIALPTFDDLDDDLMESTNGNIAMGSTTTNSVNQQNDDNSPKDVEVMESQESSLGKATTTAENATSLLEKTAGSTSLCENNSKEHDVPYFRQLLVDETNKLNEMCNRWEGLQSENPDLSEEVCGQIRTAKGKAQLLISQRFKQFSSLVDACEFKTGEKETTCQDLQGFWDMVYFQVEDVGALFDELKELESNNWQKVQKAVKESTKPVTKKKKVPTATLR